MKKLFFSIIFWLSLVLHAQGFEVNNFTADIYLHQGGYFDVVENYDIDFTTPKHGIFRDIIVNYDFIGQDGNKEKRKIDISKIEVPDHPYSAFFPMEKFFEGFQRIKIGSANTLVSGKQHYEIKYRVKNAHISEDHRMEFYWNIKPADWITTFQKIEFRIHAPEVSELSSENCFTYSGASGINTVSEGFSYTYQNGVYTGISKPDFTSSNGDNVTVLMKLPEHTFNKVSAWQKNIEKYGWIGILLMIISIFGLSYLVNGRTKGLMTVTSYYPPDGMDPAMAGVLINKQKIWNTKDNLNSLLPYWGSLGLITITEAPNKGWFGKTDFLLTRLKEISENAPQYEKNLFQKIFEGTEKDTKTPNGVYLQSAELRKRLSGSYMSCFFDLLKQAKTYIDIPARRRMRATGCLLAILAFVLAGIFIYFYGFIAAVVTWMVLMYFGLKAWKYKKRNAKGVAAINELSGFYQFIKMAEIDRIKTLLKEDPNYFEKTMPYAMAFGMLSQWAKRFDGLEVSQPNWYNSSTSKSISGLSNTFSTGAFASSFSTAVQSFSTATVSSPSRSSGSSSHSSSGGGHSGGGFGGGGGGSW